MSHKTVDCRGLACPQPVINTKKAIEEPGVASVTTIVDNDVARQNVTLFARNAGYTVTEKQADGAFHLTIDRQESAPARETVPDGKPVTPAVTGAPVYFITTNSLGQGSPDLGHVLMKSLFTTLAAMDPPPAALLFLNTGVFLTCDGSPVLEQLEKLHAAGTAVLSCGTCLEYYKLKDKLQLGNISNMFDINNWLYGPYKTITIA
ncbi:sulfurtransferase-like selenium metabolism protein YedF [Desulfoscipio geothermicus]|uniref:Selenium metabolism protein YedF n=1 Tax=Desulfoscipio geothermicus DSM 3669 TaxID=1121426 RepID=A0A1I6D3Y7_9FIRM|nr:sulfurtransferase-like selenium metabolism protein YedF [Desulfoscipio geothermicus]SFR00073.1 selenium metabolism protein YedF [Desulfoscipio geothermicus DSM 3669]